MLVPYTIEVKIEYRDEDNQNSDIESVKNGINEAFRNNNKEIDPDNIEVVVSDSDQEGINTEVAIRLRTEVVFDSLLVNTNNAVATEVEKQIKNNGYFSSIQFKTYNDEGSIKFGW